MSVFLSARTTVFNLFFLLVAVSAVTVYGQTNYVSQGDEYAIAGSFYGDQVFPSAAINNLCGFVVWQDNITDGSGWGISARRLDATLSGAAPAFRVNATGDDDQENPKVALFNNKNGAIVVWQSGKPSFQHIYGRLFTGTNTFVTTNDVLISASKTNYQQDAAVAVLTNGNMVVAYASYNQVSGNSLQDVYFQRLSTNGSLVGNETLVNQFTEYNQRTPAVAALKDGRFVVVWVSEQERTVVTTSTNSGAATSQPYPSVDIYARFFTAVGAPMGNEFLVNSSFNVCANPSVAVTADNTFAVVWSEKSSDPNDSWDISMRTFSSAGVGGVTRRINTVTYGDQYKPTIVADGAAGFGYMVVWTSLGEDGSREGVYGRFVNINGTFPGDEFRVNTVTPNQQIHPAVACDLNGRFLAVWSSFAGLSEGFDLYAQRYAADIQPLSAPNAPYVFVVSSNALNVTWSSVAGLEVANYEIYADGAPSAMVVVTNNYWTATGLSPSSTHSYKLAYRLADGRLSPLSAASTNTTYSAFWYMGSIPPEWMIAYFGSAYWAWPSPTADSDGDGKSNLQEFLEGTDPTQSSSALNYHLESTPQGIFLYWNTEPGMVYQVQTSSDLSNWMNVDAPRFAAGHVDSLYVGGSVSGYYRVGRLR